MEPQNVKLYNGLVQLLEEILPLITPAIASKYFPNEIDNYPNLSYNAKGFPVINLFPKKIAVSNAFTTNNSDSKLILLANFPIFNEVLEEIKAIPEFCEYYAMPVSKRDNMIDLNGKIWIQDVIERYFYIHGEVFEKNHFNDIYEPLENFIYASQLRFDIAVPLLFIGFETDIIDLAPGIIIRKISDDANKARHKIVSYSPNIVDSVYMTATYEFVLTGYYYNKPNNWWQAPFSTEQIYPNDIIRKLIATIKIATGISTGYAQILIYPNNWEDNYNYDLISLKGAMGRNYPGFFDNYYWNNESYPVVNAAHIEDVCKVFSALINSKANKLEFAIKRLYKSILRKCK